jgi:hypothetical protein
MKKESNCDDDKLNISVTRDTQLWLTNSLWHSKTIEVMMSLEIEGHATQWPKEKNSQQNTT